MDYTGNTTKRERVPSRPTLTLLEEQSSQGTIIDGIRYIPTSMTTQLNENTYLHALILIKEEDMTPEEDLESMVTNAEYYIRYSDEDVQQVRYDEVINALHDERPLLSLCGKKFAETPKQTITTNIGTTEYIIELRISDTADTNKVISSLADIFTEDCPSGLTPRGYLYCEYDTCSSWSVKGPWWDPEIVTKNGICEWKTGFVGIGGGCWCSV